MDKKNPEGQRGMVCIHCEASQRRTDNTQEIFLRFE